MKIRTGFVSNSSTTSFTIWGMLVEWNNLKDNVKKYFNNDPYKFDMNSEHLDKFTDLEIHYDNRAWLDTDVYLGKSLEYMNDDETYGDFKDDVAERLKEILINVDPYVVDISYYDG